MTNPFTSVNKRLGIFNSLMLIANIMIILALALSYLSVHFSPEKSLILPFFGLLYPFLIIISLFFVIYWILRRRWLFLASAIMIMAGWNHLERTVQVRFSDKKPENNSYFKIITYNVKNLSNDNVDLVDSGIRNNILGYLEEQNPDIVCLQEFAVVGSDPEMFIKSFADRLKMPYYAHSQYFEKQKKYLNAILIFSKFPILDYGSVKKDNMYNYALFTNLLIREDTVRLYNIHLQSLRLRHEDYNFVSGLDQSLKENDNLKAGLRRIIVKLKNAFSQRALQVDTIASCILNSPYPVILCGDFNDTPNSYAYQKLTDNLKDAFMESGMGFGNTYIGKLPSYRIDYILYNDYFTSRECRRDLVKFSDHYPVRCMIGIRQKE